MKINTFVIALASVISVNLSLVSVDRIFNCSLATAQAATTKKVPALRNKVYGLLANAQQLADKGDKQAGLAALDAVKERIGSMNSYERAMLWNFYGFMYYGNDDIDQAIIHFKKVIAEDAIPETLKLSTLYSLAQLSMQQQNYPQAISYLKQWKSLNSKPLTADQQVLFGQVHYQNKQYQQTVEYVNQAIELAHKKGKTAKENWLILLRATYYELKQPEQVTQVMEQMVKLFDKADYWLQLAGMYGEIGQEQKQLATMETAWQAGFISKKADIMTLAQLYLYHQVPYKAAEVIKIGLKKGYLQADEKTLALQAQAYIRAKNNDKAEPVLIAASKLVKHGKYEAQLAQTYLNTEQWQKAIESAEKALDKGDLNNQGNMYLVQGMAYFNLEQYDNSLNALAQAKEFKATAKVAKQWYAYVEKEKGHQMQLASAY